MPTQPPDRVTQTSPQAQAQQAYHSPAAAEPGSGPHVTMIAGVAIAPDGQTVAWSQRGPVTSGLHLTSVKPSDNTTERLISVNGASGCSYGSPVWSPDGQTLAFLSNCAPLMGQQTKDQQQLFLWSKSTGQVRQLTHLTGQMQQPAWSPDGKVIGFLFVENATRSAGALDAMKPFSGVIGEDGVEIQRVEAIDVETGAGNWLTPANLHVYEFDWSPNSHEIAFIGANPPGENTWWVAKLFTATFTRNLAITNSDTKDQVEEQLHAVVDTKSVQGPLRGLQMAVPRWSPDGKRLAFIGGLMSDQGSTGGDVYVVDAQGGQPVNVTPGIDGTPCYETWVRNDTLGFVEDRRGHTLLVDWNVDKKAAAPRSTLDLGEVSVGGGPIKDAISFTHAHSGDMLAFTEQGFTEAPEVWTVGARGPQKLTHVNDSAKATARTESVEWTNGAFHVQGWLTLPAEYDPAKHYPMIVTVHGGPSASITARWGGGLWAERGYFEFQPNPRGSFGQGEAFTAANRKDFGYGDLKDIEAGMDYVESKYSIDKNREGLTGWSYGGFMTMFAVTQTHRFKAAVAGAGLSDWLSYYGENSIDQWMIPFFGASVYDDPAVYAKSSAITYIKNVTTPTLVIVGDRDGECPAPQSFEFWHALRDLGVKTQLVVYPNEGHGFKDPEHIHDRNERTAKWFADNMPASN
ncbi:MAG: prolyl oligopeptidase family serine peptidase [Janthinobacterium lividum]